MHRPGMNQPSQLRGLFVSHRSTLSGTSGGPPICTAEFWQVLEECGFELIAKSFDSDRSLPSRLRRRLFNRPYGNLVPASVIPDVVQHARDESIGWIFLNFRDSISIAPALRAQLPEARIVHLSHGPDSVDYLHELRGRDTARPFHGVSGKEEKRLARQLFQECLQREAVDEVICLSTVETGIEQWLGARRVTWLPRIVTPAPLEWQPVGERVGFVGSLDHPPNVEGLHRVLDRLVADGHTAEVRLVGGPAPRGEELERAYPNVHYCGRLSDEDLRAEASTWSCFLHPVFCFARGASTKLATGLSWEIPIVTTTPGTRGYRWSEGELLIAETASGFVEHVARLLAEPAIRDEAREQARRVAASSPQLDDVVASLSRFLGLQDRA